MSLLTQWRPHDPGCSGERSSVASPLGERGDGIVQGRRYIEPCFGLPGQSKSPCDPASYGSFRPALPARFGRQSRGALSDRRQPEHSVPLRGGRAGHRLGSSAERHLHCGARWRRDAQ